MSTNRILGLDGIRAYAALMVVVTHMYLFIELYNAKSPYYSLVRGIIGVQIFFVLSGLLITNLLYHEYKIYEAFIQGNFVLIPLIMGAIGGDMKIGIFGSCISRDIFREMKLDNLVKEYRARTSIHSVTQSDSADVF